MTGRPILTIAAAVLITCGAALLFAGDMAAAAVGAPGPAGEALAQVAAAGLLGLGVTDWMARDTRIGGLYGRPLALGNLLAFVVAATSLGRAWRAGALVPATAAATIAAALLAVAFGWLAFVHDPTRA